MKSITLRRKKKNIMGPEKRGAGGIMMTGDHFFIRSGLFFWKVSVLC